MRAWLSGSIFALVLGTALVLAAPQLPARVELETVLDRAGWYLDYFVDEFENVVAEETYIQDSSQLLASFSPVSGGRGGAGPAAVAVGHASGEAPRHALGFPAGEIARRPKRWCRSATSSRWTAC